MIIVTRENLDESLEVLERDAHIGLDTETTGLKEDDSIFSLILACAADSFYFNFNNAPGTPLNAILDKEFIFSKLKRFLENPHITWYIHNAKFDMRMLAKEGIELRGRVHCTYAIERVVKNNYFGKDAYNLAGCAKRRGLEKDERVEAFITKNKLYTTRQMPGKKKIIKDKHFDRVPFGVMSEYGATDGVLHRAIGRDQCYQIEKLSEVKRIPSLTPVYENELRFTKTAFRMERRGVKIDKPRTAEALDYEIGQINNYEKEFEALTGSPFIDSNKPLQAVFDKLGARYPLTEKGNPSFAADVLEEMDSPIANLVTKIRYHDKRAGTYYSSFLYHADSSDVIHPDTRQAGTETGRCSYRDPNLQNVPKEDEPDDQAIPYHVRECFIPRPNRFFYSIDYNQQEFRMLLDWAGEKKLIERINDGADVHQATADLCGITRKQAKTINFGLLYGMGKSKLAKSLGISEREAFDLICTYFARLPRVKPFLTRVARAGETRGYIFNWFGRRCHIAQRDWSYILPNHFIQGGCADVIKRAMNIIDDMLLETKAESAMLLQVHDELLLEVPPNEADIILKVKDIMESVYPAQNGMKLTTSVEHSIKSWGYRHKIKGMYGQAAA